MLIRVLLSGVGVYLSPFKDVWGSRIIFAGLSKVFSQANKDQQRESNRAVNSLYSRDILGDSIDYMNERDVRFDYSCKMKTSSHLGSIKDRIGIKCSDKAKKQINIIKICLACLAWDRSQPLVNTPILIVEALNIKFPWFNQGKKKLFSFTEQY